MFNPCYIRLLSLFNPKKTAKRPPTEPEIHIRAYQNDDAINIVVDEGRPLDVPEKLNQPINDIIRTILTWYYKKRLEIHLTPIFVFNLHPIK